MSPAAKSTSRTREKTKGKQRSKRLTVALTGPTGDIGRSLLRALDRHRDVAEIRAMARRPFDTKAAGLRKTSYSRGDVLDRASVDELVTGADVVVHLAFLILGSLEDTQRINLEGTRNVFRATADAGASRLVYASSVAAYGFHADNPLPLTEEIPPRGTERHYYSAQKAELERVLDETLADSKTDAYVFRPCIVAGEDALALLENIPYIQLSERMPSPILRMLEVMPALKPVLPDPGVPFQLVHHDDVASAMRAGVLGQGTPGVYNLAGEGELTLSDIADSLGWYSIPVPELALGATAEVLARVPFLPAEAQWIESFRTPVLMDTSKARRELRWRPKHDARSTLREMVDGGRREQLIR